MGLQLSPKPLCVLTDQVKQSSKQKTIKQAADTSLSWFHAEPRLVLACLLCGLLLACFIAGLIMTEGAADIPVWLQLAGRCP